MWPDVLRYREFYASPLGKLLRETVRLHVMRRWGNTAGETILGLGYTPPFLQDFDGKCLRLIACMPAPQGVVHWPGQEHNRTLIADDGELPFPNNSVDRLLMVHMAEHSFSPLQMLEEAWRVLSPGGSLLILVPNRRGIWARRDNTPLGYGRPFSRSQLKQLLEEHRFTIHDAGMMLFFPPSEKRLWLKHARLLEVLGRCFLPMFGGMLWMEAEKQLYATHKQAVFTRRKYGFALPAQSAEAVTRGKL